MGATRKASLGIEWMADGRPLTADYRFMPDSKPTDLRRHREMTDRNLLIGFFAVLFIVGGGLIWLMYGGGAMAMGLVCMMAGAMLTGLVLLIMLGLQWVSDWLERNE